MFAAESSRASRRLTVASLTVVSLVLALAVPALGQWAPEIRMTNNTGESRLCGNGGRAVVCGPGGEIFLIWQDTRSGLPQIYFKFFTPALGWSGDSAVTATTFDETAPSACGDSNGNLHAVWLSKISGYNQIQYSRFSFAKGWSTAEQVTTHSSQHYDPVVAVDGAGNVHTAWYGHDMGHLTVPQVFYRKRTTLGWAATETLTTSSHAQSAPSIAVDRQGDVHLAWSGKSALWPTVSQINYRRRASGGWLTAEAVTNSADSCGRPALAVEPANYPHVVWHRFDATARQQIYYARRDSTSWTVPTALTTSPYNKQNPALAGDSLSRMHVVWCGCEAASPSVRQVFYRQRNAAGSWLTQEQLTSASGGTRDQVLSSAKPNGAPHLVWQDTRDGNLEVYYLGQHFADPLTVTIMSPVGRIDSSITVMPKAVVRNGGTQTAVFTVRLRVGSTYDRTLVDTVAAQATDTVSFAYWSAVTRGTYAVVCSVGQAGDVNARNNAIRDSVIVSVRDVAAIRITNPLGIVDSGQVRVPSAWIRNLGTVAESITVTMRVGAGYSSSQGRVVYPGESLLVAFANWTARPRGWHAVRCTVRLLEDQVAGNNLARDSAFVRVTDGDVITLLRPAAGDVQYGSAQPCTATVANRGNATQSFLVRFLARRAGGAPFYRDSVISSFAPGEQRNVGFRNWVPDSVGSVQVRCTLALSGDQVVANNAKTNALTVLAHDVAVLAILAPSGTIDSGNSALPRAVVRNGGFHAEIPRLVMTIGAQFTDTASCTLAVGQTDTVSFDNWAARERGSLAVRCTVLLVQDDMPGNNRALGSVFVRVVDAAVTQITAPAGIVDSPATVCPSVQVRNAGTQTDSVTLLFRIGTGYAQTRGISIPAGQTVTATFPGTGLGPRGRWAVSCTASLVGDRLAANNRLQDSILVRVRDGVMLQLLAPVSEYDSGQTAIPSASVQNQGSHRDTFSVTLRIGGSYLDTKNTVLQAGEEALLSFAPWPALRRGAQTASCSIAVLHDVRSLNNRISRSVMVHVHDLEMAQILDFPLEIAEGTAIAPRAILRNPGNQTENGSAVFEIRPAGGVNCYVDTLALTLAPGEVDTAEFFYWTATPPGSYVGRCAVLLGNDLKPVNDTGSVRFSVVDMLLKDVGVEAVLQPAPRIYPGGVVPKAQIRNFGETPVSFRAYFWIRLGGLSGYLDSNQVEGLPPGGTCVVSFREWQATPGFYQMRCSTYLLDDENRANDALTQNLQVDSLAAGDWRELANYPAGEKNKKTKHGACLAAVPGGRIFSLKGSNTCEFYVYDANANAWQKCDSLPFAADKKKKAGKGASLAWCPDDGRLYALKGNNTSEFWSFGLDSNRWRQEPSLPAGASGRAAKSGAALCYGGTEHGLFALKGNKTLELWRFDPRGDSWSRRTPMPEGPSRKAVGEGGALVWDGSSRLYALKGNSQAEWFAYEPAADRWTELSALPAGSARRRAKDGACATAGSAAGVHVLKGNNTVEFFYYDAALGVWAQRPGMPAGPAGRRVKGGGTMTCIGDQVYALKGNGTFEFYTYVPVGGAAPVPAERPERQSVLQPGSTLTGSLTVGPNPASGWVELAYSGGPVAGSARVRVFDAGGRIAHERPVSAQAPTRIDLTGLAAGVYLLEFDADGRRFVRKVVIER